MLPRHRDAVMFRWDNAFASETFNVNAIEMLSTVSFHCFQLRCTQALDDVHINFNLKLHIDCVTHMNI